MNEEIFLKNQFAEVGWKCYNKRILKEAVRIAMDKGRTT